MTSSAHQTTSLWLNDVIRKLCGGLLAVCPWSAAWAWRRYTRGSQWIRPCCGPPSPGPGPPTKPAVRPANKQKKCSVSDSVPDPEPNLDPDPPDPHVFGSPGSESTSKSYASGSGSFDHQAIIVRKTLIPTVLWLFLDFYLWKMMYEVHPKSNWKK